MNKILDVSDIFSLKLASLSIPVLISIVIGSIAIFLFTNKPSKQPEAKNTRKQQDNNGKKKKRANIEGESKVKDQLIQGPAKKERIVKSNSVSVKKQTSPPVKKSSKLIEEGSRSKDVKVKKQDLVAKDINEEEGWQTVTKKQKKQAEAVKIPSKTSPKKRQEKNNKGLHDNRNVPTISHVDKVDKNIEVEQPSLETKHDTEWIENKPTKKNKKRALRE